VFKLFIYILNLFLDTFLNILNLKNNNNQDNLVYQYKIQEKPNGYKNTYSSSLQNYPTISKNTNLFGLTPNLNPPTN